VLIKIENYFTSIFNFLTASCRSLDCFLFYLGVPSCLGRAIRLYSSCKHTCMRNCGVPLLSLTQK